MTIDQMRQALIGAYPASKHWKAKVTKMPDNQVIAIYKSMKLKNQL